MGEGGLFELSSCVHSLVLSLGSGGCVYESSPSPGVFVVSAADSSILNKTLSENQAQINQTINVLLL